MNAKIAIIAGLVMACPLVLQAEEPASTADGNELSAAKTAVSFRTILWTNNMDFHAAENSFPTDGYTNGTLPKVVIEYGDTTMSNEYQVIAVYRNDGIVEFSEIDAELTAAVITNNSLPDMRNAGEFYSWKYGTGTSAGSGQIRKQPTQILIIEPLKPGKDFTPERIRIQEYCFGATHQDIAWYEWINPRLFLIKWEDYWVNGAGATPVALMIITF